MVKISPEPTTRLKLNLMQRELTRTMKVVQIVTILQLGRYLTYVSVIRIVLRPTRSLVYAPSLCAPIVETSRRLSDLKLVRIPKIEDLCSLGFQNLGGMM